MGLCAMAATAEEFMSFQLLSEAAIQPCIGAQFRSDNKSQVSNSQECLTLYRNQTCQGMSCGIQMNGQRQKRELRMTEEVCHGGGSEHTKWNRGSCRRVKVKLERDYTTELESTVGPVDGRIIPWWRLLRE